MVLTEFKDNITFVVKHRSSEEQSVERGRHIETEGEQERERREERDRETD